MTGLSNLATHKNKASDYQHAKSLRQTPTNGEEILWYALRVGAKSSDIKFRRQHPLRPYVVDFVCLKARLIVEVDGSSHDARLDKDKNRDKHLARMGYEVLRFTNEDVVKDREAVVRAIYERANAILGANSNPAPCPSRKGRGIPML